jgi:hypothetical protein
MRFARTFTVASTPETVRPYHHGVAACVTM